MKIRNRLSFRITLIMMCAFVLVLFIQTIQGVNRYINNYISVSTLTDNNQHTALSPYSLSGELRILVDEYPNIHDSIYKTFIKSVENLGNNPTANKYYLLDKQKKVLASSDIGSNHLIVARVPEVHEQPYQFLIDTSVFTQEEKELIAKTLTGTQMPSVKVAGEFGSKDYYYKSEDAVQDVYGRYYAIIPIANRTTKDDFDYTAKVSTIDPTYLEINGVKIRDGSQENLIQGINVLGYKDDKYMYSQSGINLKYELLDIDEVFNYKIDEIVHGHNVKSFYSSNASAYVLNDVIDGQYYSMKIIPLKGSENVFNSIEDKAIGHFVQLTYYPNLRNEMIKEYLKDNLWTYLLVLMSAIVISIVSSKIIVKPIKNIERVSKKIANKEFDEIIKIKDNTEIGSLANSINEMSSQLETTINELQSEIKHVKKIEAQRKEFIANFTHEMKTPLAIIDGYSELLEETQDEEKRKNYLTIINDETIKIDKLIKAMLKLSKLELNKVNLNLEQVNLEGLITHCIDSLTFQLQEKNAKVKLTCDSQEVVCDKEEMQTVLNNLLSNAIRHVNQNGLINIELTKEMLSVENEGDTIPESKLETIWEAFQSDHTNGTGLGLAICKNIIELHGFKYGVINTENGVKFMILFKDM